MNAGYKKEEFDYKHIEILIYTVSFAVISVAVVAFLYINGRTLIHTADGYEQYYPVFMYIGKYFRDVFNEQGIKLYDFSIGLGEGIIDTLNYYGFGDPLSLLAVFATKQAGEYIFALCIFVRIYIAGLGMVFFLKEHSHKGILVSGGGILYAFSLYTFIHGLSFYTWMNMVYLLPFLLLTVEKIIKGKHVSRNVGSFAFLIFVAACSGFYFLYMLTIWIFLYACYVYWKAYYQKFCFRHLIAKAGQVFASYCLGVITAGIILFPSLNGFFNSSRGIGSTEKWSFFPSLPIVMENFSNLVIPMTGNAHPGLGLSFFCILGIVGIWCDKSKKTKGFLLLILAAYFCPAFGRIMNGFGYTSNRWIYAVHFVIIYMTVMVLEKYLEGKVLDAVIIKAVIIVAVSIILHFILNGDKIRSFFYLLVCILIGLGLIRKVLSANIIYSLLFGTVCLNVFFLFATWRVCGHDLTKSFCTKEEIKELTFLMDNIEKNNKEWARNDLAGLTPADGLLSGEYKTAEHFSLLNHNTYSIWRELLISPGIGHATHNLRGLDSRMPVEILLGVNTYQEGETIKENPYALPLGVEYFECISNEEFESLSALTKQKVLLEKIVLDYVDSDCRMEKYEEAEVEIPCKIETANIKMEGDLCSVDSNSKIILTFDTCLPEEQEGELYVYFSDFQCMDKDFATIFIGDTKLYVQNRTNNYYTGLEDYLIHVNLKESNKLEITFQEEYVLKLAGIKGYWYNYGDMKTSVDRLRSHSLQNTVLGNDWVSGSISAEKGWLFLSIPYDNSWKAYVDGKRTCIEKANIGCMALRLEKGEHEVELRYEPGYIKTGILCTIIGSLRISLLIMGRKIILRNDRKMESSEEEPECE